MANNIESHIILYHVFDVAQEINLKTASNLLSTNAPHRIKLKKYTREVILNESPLETILGEFVLEVDQSNYSISTTAKIWSYGAISICFRIQSKTDNLNNLGKLLNHIETSEELKKHSREKCEEVMKVIDTSLLNPSLWDDFEDYIVIQFPFEKSTPINYSMEDFYQMIEGSKHNQFSKQSLNYFQSGTYQYGENDLLIIDWNRAIIWGENQDVEDIKDILEFALIQLFELRYYDDLLDDKLYKLYDSLEEAKNSILKNKYSKFSKEAAMYFLEISEVIDKIGNSLKVVGDTYYARIYRSALERFRVNDWKLSVSDKLSNLASLSQLFSNETNERRNQLMELIIIMLIAIEVIPYLVSVFKPLIEQLINKF